MAVISVFNAPPELRARALHLLKQVERVILVDDGSASLGLQDVPEDNVIQIRLQKNLGIATALNVGVERAQSLGATHVLTLDQDSDLEPDHVRRLLDALRREEHLGAPVAAAVPAHVGGVHILMAPDGQPFDPIQSGQLIPVETFRSIGGFEESLFIDAVDSEFTARARRAGFRFVSEEGVAMRHALGESVPLKILGRHVTWAGKPRHVLYHQSWRTYYMVRNSLFLKRKYLDDDKLWVRRRNRRMFEMVFACVLFGPFRRSQILAIRRARQDAHAGAYGRIPESTMADLRKWSRS